MKIFSIVGVIFTATAKASKAGVSYALSAPTIAAVRASPIPCSSTATAINGFELIISEFNAFLLSESE